MGLKDSYDRQVGEYIKRRQEDVSLRLSDLLEISIQPQDVTWIGDSNQSMNKRSFYNVHNIQMATDFGALGVFPLLNLVKVVTYKRVMLFWKVKQERWEIFDNISDFYGLLKQMPEELALFESKLSENKK